MTKIAIASDHAGYNLKEVLKAYLQQDDYEVTDFGTNSNSSVDYPDFIHPAAVSVAEKKAILVLCSVVVGMGKP